MQLPTMVPRLAPFVRKLEGRARLSLDDREALLALPSTERKVDAGKYVFKEGSRSETCTILLCGFVQRHKVAGDGGRQIVGVHMAGDVIDLASLGGLSIDYSVQALTPAKLAEVPTVAVQALLRQRPAIADALWADSLSEASVFREWLVNIGRRDARTRMAHLLCELAVRHQRANASERTTFELHLTQEQLGDVLGLTAVHVNRTMKRLAAEGLIRYQRGRVFIFDWNGLSAAGDFDPRYLNFAPTEARVVLAT